MEVADLQRRSWEIAESKGFHEPQVREGILRVASPAECLILMHEEITEALRVIRNGRDLTEIWYEGEKQKPEGFGIELADLIIRAVELAEQLGIDMEKCLEIKSTYNAGREWRHGGKTL